MATPTPRFSTSRTPSRDNLLSQAENIAKGLGLSLQPWQSEATALFTELNKDGTLAFNNGTILVSRQSGKTTLLLVWMLLRCLAQPDTRVFYSSQALKESRDKLLNEWTPILDRSPLAGTYTVNRANGSEAIRFANRSSIRLLASQSQTSMHGVVCDMWVCDEAFALTDSRAENSMVPAQATRTKRGLGVQTVVISTAGTYDLSPYLWDKVQRGRDEVQHGLTNGSAYIEWSAPDDAEPSDEEVWKACNPSIGHTISLDAIQAEWNTLSRADFQRSRLCQFVTTATETVIPLELWHELEDPVSAPDNSNLVFAFDASPDSLHASICVASRRTDGRVHVERVHNAEHTGWLVEKIKELANKYSPDAIVCAAKNPAATYVPELAAAGIQVRALDTQDETASFATFIQACHDHVLVHRDDPVFVAALCGAVRRKLESSDAFSRKNSSIDISPLVALSQALYVVLSEQKSEHIYDLNEIIRRRSREALELQGVTERDLATRPPMPGSRAMSWVSRDPNPDVCPTESDGSIYTTIQIG